MKDRYRNFSEKEFEYEYPFSWKKRNKDYLKLRQDRRKVITKPLHKKTENNIWD